MAPMRQPWLEKFELLQGLKIEALSYRTSDDFIPIFFHLNCGSSHNDVSIPSKKKNSNSVFARDRT